MYETSRPSISSTQCTSSRQVVYHVKCKLDKAFSFVHGQSSKDLGGVVCVSVVEKSVMIEENGSSARRSTKCQRVMHGVRQSQTLHARIASICARESRNDANSPINNTSRLTLPRPYLYMLYAVSGTFRNKAFQLRLSRNIAVIAACPKYSHMRN